MKLLHLIESGRIDSEAVGKSHNEAWRLQKPTISSIRKVTLLKLGSKPGIDGFYRLI